MHEVQEDMCENTKQTSEMTERRCASVSRGTILAISPIAGSKYTSSSAAAVSPAAGSATLTPAISDVGVSANADKADSAVVPPLPRDLASAAATAAATDPWGNVSRHSVGRRNSEKEKIVIKSYGHATHFFNTEVAWIPGILTLT